MIQPIERLISLARAKAPLRVIAAELGISMWRAWQDRRRYAPGCEARRGRPGMRRKRVPSTARSQRRQRIVDALKSGATDEQVAEAVGATRHAVAYIRKRYTSLRRKRGPKPRPPSTITQDAPCPMIPKAS